ncbi:MAG: murein hydrolase activator EnvC family protein, partial [Gaiellaceae bacterium]
MRRILLVLVAVALVGVPAASAWTWPVDGPVLRPFLLGDDPYAGGQHRGVDIGGEVGRPVRAPASGTVSFVGSVPGGGHALTIETADGLSVTLLQLATTTVSRGDVVEEGAVVGTVGESADGVTTAPHVHLGIRVTADRNGYVDPLSLLGAPAAPAERPAAGQPVQP